MAAQQTGNATGTLYLVGTPIGNLEDITLRALRLLREVDLIAAEDTRVTRKLLQRHRIATPAISYHAHSGERRRRELVSMLRSGKSIALVSDAGMPGTSDPGADLVRAAREAGACVVVVPGPSAVASALAISGIPGQQYLFLGFLPNRSTARKKALQQAACWSGPVVCFEAPQRLQEALADIASVLGDRQVAVARELTKLHEEAVQGSVSDLIAHFASHQPRGEITVVLAPPVGQASSLPSPDVLQEVLDLITAGLSPSRAVAHVARHRRVSRRDLYRTYLEITHRLG